MISILNFRGVNYPLFGEVSVILHCLAWCRLVIYLTSYQLLFSWLSRDGFYIRQNLMCICLPRVDWSHYPP